MAKVRQNIVIQGLSGTLGDQLVIKQDKAGRTIVSTKPTFDENRQFSEAQQAQHDAFREASAYAKTARSNEIYAEKAAGKATSTYNVAMADWFHAPEILELDITAWHGNAGDVIRVRAIDDVQVTQVNIMITDANGVVLEQGQATRADGLWWTYTTESATAGATQIVAVARDLPGHVGEMRWAD